MARLPPVLTSHRERSGWCGGKGAYVVASQRIGRPIEPGASDEFIDSCSPAQIVEIGGEGVGGVAHGVVIGGDDRRQIAQRCLAVVPCE
jgi:hypothetical protein